MLTAPPLRAEAPLDKLVRLRELQREVAEREAAERRTQLAEKRAELIAAAPTPAHLAERLDPKYVRTEAVDLVAARLVDAARQRDGRLVISVPPQEMKTTLLRWLGYWLLLDNPDLRIVYASYAASLARGTGRAVRTHVGTYGADYGLTLDRGHADASDWELADHVGGMVTVGVGGALTGRPADCVPGDVRLQTPTGVVFARDLHGAAGERVLSFNHDTGRAEYRRIEATRRIAARPLVEVVTAAGRVLRCTPDHRVHTADGYRQAALLRPGDRLITSADVRGMRRPGQQEGPDVQRLLHEGASVDVDDAALHAVRQAARGDARGAREEAPPRANQPLLLARVCGGIALGPSQGSRLPAVRRPDRERQRPEVLHAGVPGRSPQAVAVHDVPDLLDDVHAKEHAPGVLLTAVCERGARQADDRHGELALPGRHELRRLVPLHASADLRAGRRRVPGVPAGGPAVAVQAPRQVGRAVVDARAPHRPRPAEQPAGEPHPAVPAVPRDTPQVGADTVSLVRRVRGPGEPVYDFQVEGNRNFFAGEVLVHNCLIVDDPIRNQADADSETVRENLHDWWSTVALTRMAPGCPAIVVQTRWAEDDLAGRRIAEGWPLVNIPALADGKTEDALGRPAGVWLTSARGRSVADWEAKRKDVGERTFAALYQGRPAPLEGGIFKRAWFDTWRVTAEQVPDGATRTVVIDPADNEGSGDEAGILLVAVSGGKVYVVDDLSAAMTVARWARVALLTCVRHGAPQLVYEQSLSQLPNRIRDVWRQLHQQATALDEAKGDPEKALNLLARPVDGDDARASLAEAMAELTLDDAAEILRLGSVGPRLKAVTAKGKKDDRMIWAAPKVETGRLVLAGHFPKLEHQAVTWQVGMDSPDRVDALCHAASLESVPRSRVRFLE